MSEATKSILTDGDRCMLEIARNDGSSLMIPGVFESEEGAVGFRVSDRVAPFTINPRDIMSLIPIGAVQ